METDYDIIIVGSGVVGATAALALAQATSLRIALLEAQPFVPSTTDYDHRVSAISLASKRMLQGLKVWPQRVSPYTQMYVWDEGGTGDLRFVAQEIGEVALGYIVEDRVLRGSLLAAITQSTQITFLQPIQLTALQYAEHQVILTTADDAQLTARLLIAADGAQSWVRTQSHIEVEQRDYAQSAIVATVQTELPHEHTAWQRFLSTGPLAFLPLADPLHCSIVWSATHSCATEWMSLTNEDFQTRLASAFAHRLGAITQVSPRYLFPLQMRHTKEYVRPRLALVGDAAHTLHPLAGQGVNLGLLDVACLVDVISVAIAKKRDFSHFATLRRYARARRADNAIMLTLVDLLNRLFSNQHQTLQSLRNVGLRAVNQRAFIKKILIGHATGRMVCC